MVHGNPLRRRGLPPSSSQPCGCRFVTTVLGSRLVGVIGGSNSSPGLDEVALIIAPRSIANLPVVNDQEQTAFDAILLVRLGALLLEPLEALPGFLDGVVLEVLSPELLRGHDNLRQFVLHDYLHLRSSSGLSSASFFRRAPSKQRAS